MTELRIAFVGQCHTKGYPGVPADLSFPEVCRGVLQASRPARRVRLLLEPYYHPFELPRVVRAALRRDPRVVVIEVVGWLVVTGSRVIDLSRLPPRVRSPFERLQHFRRAARVVTERSRPSGPLYQAKTTALGLAGDVLRPLLPRYPRPSLSEYENALSVAMGVIAEHGGVSTVIQGPGAPNLELNRRGIAPDAIDRYRAVNAMSRRVATRHDALFIERWDTVAGGFFLPGSIRPGKSGHSVWGHLLANQLLGAGIV
jgi:hypothetical protein